MSLNQAQRLELYECVKRSSLGKAGADIVMNAIPTVDWTDLVTHDDLALLRSDLRGEMAELRGELRGEMAELRGELRGEMAELRGELRSEMLALESRLQRSIITWILAAQSVTLVAIGLLISVLMIMLS